MHALSALGTERLVMDVPRSGLPCDFRALQSAWSKVSPRAGTVPGHLHGPLASLDLLSAVGMV